jgi:hypothetical protein
MDFTVVKKIEGVDVDGNDTSENVTTNYVGTLNSGTFIVTLDEVMVVSQPWNPLPDGTNGEWVDLDEAILWFQTNSNHITGE